VSKSVILAGVVATVAVAAPAQAKPHPAKTRSAKPAQCEPRAVGYNARGTLVSANVTQTAGQATPRSGDDRYSGTVEVDVKKANHKAPTGVQTFSLTNAKVRFYDANDDNVADEPKAGDRVKLHGKITKLKRRCDQTGFTPQITVRHVRFRPPKPPAT
jgi:hypothetical protein